MKKFIVREVETLRTTAAMYDCGCPGQETCEEFCVNNPYSLDCQGMEQ